ncbi:hypothetical protein K3720_13730 [Leisingera caerulea]|uniref:hypothetical protein n=1 Tax=Leisingera caerulea TaxID=506591 RepID=UPI0021A5DF2B|nr:hypothetical protein [Leisingera caerulea]UWQ48974.1 hypothetical protein K3720_13730 [Leisingera caerulea]
MPSSHRVRHGPELAGQSSFSSILVSQQSANIQLMKLADVHACLSDGRLNPSGLPAGIALPYLTAFSILAKITGVPLFVFDSAGAAFAARYPKNALPAEAEAYFKGDVAAYNSWRNLILDAQLLAVRGLVDCDAWDGLRRVARICRGRAFATRLYHVSSRIPEGLLPWDIDRELAVRIDAALAGQGRSSFRQGLGALDALHREALAREAGLLPPAKIGRLPKLTDHAAQFQLPPALVKFWQAASSPDRNALSFVWRMARMAGIFSAADDPAPEVFFAGGRGETLAGLDPQDFGLHRPSQNTYGIYLRRLSCRFTQMGGAGLPEGGSQAERRWAELKDLARLDPALSPARVWSLAAISKPAINDGLAPADLEPQWFEARIKELAGPKRRAFLSACYALNELCAAHDGKRHLLPPAGTGVQRQRGRLRPS